MAVVIAILGGLGAAVMWATSTLSTSRSTKLVSPVSVVPSVMAVGVGITAPVPLGGGGREGLGGCGGGVCRGGGRGEPLAGGRGHPGARRTRRDARRRLGHTVRAGSL